MEELLRGIVPGVDLNFTEGLDLNWEDEDEEADDSPQTSSNKNTSALSMNGRRQPVRESSESSFDTESALSPLADDLGKLTLDADGQTRYVGGSSGFYLLEAVREYQAKASGQPYDDSKGMRTVFWRASQGKKEYPTTEPEYPSSDVVDHLIELYFEFVYPQMPIVHRPTFLKEVQMRDTITDPSWRCLFLNILANAVSFTDRPELKEKGKEFHSGAKYYMDDTMNSARLVSLQALVYMCMYLQSNAAASPVWMLLGAAVRFGQELGLHRDASRWNFTPIEQEIRKRVFWALYVADRQSAVGLGRPFSIQDFDCDVPYPEDVDDENITLEGIKRQKGLSKISCFIENVKLQVIVGRILQNIYAINKARIKDGQMPSIESDQQLVTELDSALNEWLEATPTQLRWNPNEPDPAICTRAAFLQTSFYANQNLIHRNFIRKPDLPEATSFPSLAICTNAARGTIHIIDALRKRGILRQCGMFAVYHLFVAASVLLITIWQNKADLSATCGSSAQVQICVDCLLELSGQYEIADKCRMIITELAHFSEVALRNEGQKQSSKRRMDEVEIEDTATAGMGLTGIDSNAAFTADGIPTQVMSPNSAVRQLLLNFPDVLSNPASIDEAMRAYSNIDTTKQTPKTVPPSSMLENLALPSMATPKSQTSQLPPPGPAYGMGQVGGSLGLSPGPANMLNTAFWQMPASMEWDDWESYMSQIGNTSTGTSPNMQLGINLPPASQM